MLRTNKNVPFAEPNTKHYLSFKKINAMQEYVGADYEDGDYRPSRETIIKNQLKMIYSLCLGGYEPVSVSYPTGIRHQRIQPVWIYFNTDADGSWLPMVEYLSFLVFPRLKTKEKVVEKMVEALSSKNSGVWWEHFFKNKLDGMRTHFDETFGMEETYDKWIDGGLTEQEFAESAYDYLFNVAQMLMPFDVVPPKNKSILESLTKGKYPHLDLPYIIPQKMTHDNMHRNLWLIAYGYFVNHRWGETDWSWYIQNDFQPMDDVINMEEDFVFAVLRLFETPLMFFFDSEKQYPNTAEKDGTTGLYEKFDFNKYPHELFKELGIIDAPTSWFSITPFWLLANAISYTFPRINEGQTNFEGAIVGLLKEDYTFKDAIHFWMPSWERTGVHLTDMYSDFSGNLKEPYINYGCLIAKPFAETLDSEVLLGLGVWTSKGILEEIKKGDKELELFSYRYGDWEQIESYDDNRIQSMVGPVLLDSKEIRRSFIFVVSESSREWGFANMKTLFGDKVKRKVDR